MRILLFSSVIFIAALGATAESSFQTRSANKPNGSELQASSLCSGNEHIIFSCTVKATAKHSAKIVSLCASRDLNKDRGYLQYRFGLPGKVELEFPRDRQGTQQQFRYMHYMRFQVDLTEINFSIDDYQYQIFDNYNGEEKPALIEEGVNVTAPGKPRDATFVCRSRAKRDFSTLDDILPRDQE